MGMSVILGMLAGLGLFLYGMKLMGDGLQKVAGAKLREILETLTKNRFIGMIVGLLFTAVVQSSSATTVLVVSFVDAGLMRLQEAAGVILGANIGTTITGQLVAFKMDAVAPVFLMAGVIMIMFLKKPFVKKLGEVVLGFGILFFGMSTMSSSLEVLKESPMIVDTMAALQSPLLAVLVGFAVTAVLQSSSAVVGILILLASQGMLALNMCFYLILGCNIGSCVSALLASLSGKKMAKRSALIHLFVNIIGTAFILIVLALGEGYVYDFIRSLTSSMADESARVARDVANAHTIFKVVQVALLLPFSNYIVKLTYLFVPGEDEKADEKHLKFIGEHLVYSPTAAIPQAVSEIERMGELAFANLKRSVHVLMDKDEEGLAEIYETEAAIDYMNTEITNYLLRSNQLSLPVADRKLIGALFHVVNDIERIGDHAENIAGYTKTMIGENLNFSKEAKDGFMKMFDDTEKLLTYSIEMFTKHSEEHLQEILKLENEIDELERELQKQHVYRLTNNQCDAYAGIIYSDLCSNMERVADHGTNIAFSILEEDPEDKNVGL